LSWKGLEQAVVGRKPAGVNTAVLQSAKPPPASTAWRSLEPTVASPPKMTQDLLKRRTKNKDTDNFLSR
jgi:hypothetical protein